MESPQIFISHADEDAFEASLLQSYLETILDDLSVRVWSYKRDQAKDERSVGKSIRERVRESVAVIMVVSPFTLESGATQWMELAYADAFGVPTFVLLHHITFEELKSRSGVPPLILEGQCTPAIDWCSLDNPLRRCCEGNR